MRPSFVNQSKPFLVCVVTDSDSETAVSTMRNAEFDGAQAFDLHLKTLEPRFRNEKDLERIIMSTSRPVMALNYRDDPSKPGHANDEERVEGLLTAVRAGASACDLMGIFMIQAPCRSRSSPKRSTGRSV